MSNCWQKILPRLGVQQCHSSTCAILSLFAIVVALVGFAEPINAQVCGDVNGTQTVTTSDALSVLRVAVGQDLELTCEGECECISPRVEALEESFVSAQTELQILTSELGDAIGAVEALQQLLAGVSRGPDTIIFSGVNLQVVNGTGQTTGMTNGLGNLIIGYNEGTLEQTRTGSHNVVVGPEHEYTSTGGFLAGQKNTASAVAASVLGGSGNVAAALNSTVCGGKENRAQGPHSVVVAGLSNAATGLYATVSGGCDNDATNTFSSVHGGQAGLASGELGSVSGGFGNTASGMLSTVSGGKSRVASEMYDWRAGSLFEDQ
jgi:hypothetical protein